MTQQKRVLFLGLTGVAKGEALRKLAAYCKQRFYKSCEVVDFEAEYLFPRSPQSSFLDDDIFSQRQDWNAAWERFKASKLSSTIGSGEDIFLGLHGCYLRSHYGARSILDVRRVAQEFKPTLIVTLIADVYDMWWRTEARAHGEAWRGQPTLEHLIVGRRSEVMVADQVALECEDRPRSLVIAATHPCDTVAKCIFSDNLRLTYLSFPISEPRRLERKNDLSGINAISDLIKDSYQYQLSSNDVAFICPLAIDELPLVDCGNCLDEDETVAFDANSKRWPLAKFWQDSDRLTLPPAHQVQFPVEQIRAAAGSITTDVSWRDFRLAEQADRLAVFNPIFPGRSTVTGGVANEVTFAARFGHPIYVFQDRDLDPDGVCDTWLASYGSGTMGQSPSRRLITRKQSPAELFAAL